MVPIRTRCRHYCGNLGIYSMYFVVVLIDWSKPTPETGVAKSIWSWVADSSVWGGGVEGGLETGREDGGGGVPVQGS
jgi:hypothetical protein